MYYNKFITEYLGTVLLVLSVFASGGNPVFVGITLGLVIFLCGKMNPGNVNPAVSIAMYLKNKLSFNEMLAFIIAQVLGGVSSVYLFRAVS
jgi:aquaporin Z